jgi:copper ion binding protein
MAGVKQNRLRGTLLAVAVVVLAGVAFSVACQREQPPIARNANSEEKEMTNITVPVEGMSCGACAAQVRKKLKAIEGVRNVHVNLEQRNASIEFESGKVAPEQLTAAINELGYKAGAPAPGKGQ